MGEISMRWKQKEEKQPLSGDVRFKTGFLLFPKFLNGETRWLEKTSWVQKYGWYGLNEDGPSWEDYAWEDRYIMDKLAE
jgi:hypothetical protein